MARKRIIWSQVLNHPSDIAARQGETLRRQREAMWTDNVCDDRTRVYQALAEGHGTVSRAGEVGQHHNARAPMLQAIQYNPVTRHWERASHLIEVTQPGKVVKRVAHEVRQANNQHKGGSV